MANKGKKSRIMEQSKVLFEKFGYQKTTLTDIAKSVGYVKSAIYYYFSGKEEIFASLVQSEAKDFLENLIAEVNKHNNPDDQLRAYVNTRVELMDKVSKKYHFLKGEFFDLMPMVDENRKECDMLEIEFLTIIIAAASNNSNAEKTDHEFAAKLLMQNIKGLEVQMFVTDQVQAHNENREAFIDFILYGVLYNKQ